MFLIVNSHLERLLCQITSQCSRAHYVLLGSRSMYARTHQYWWVRDVRKKKKKKKKDICLGAKSFFLEKTSFQNGVACKKANRNTWKLSPFCTWTPIFQAFVRRLKQSSVSSPVKLCHLVMKTTHICTIYIIPGLDPEGIKTGGIDYRRHVSGGVSRERGRVWEGVPLL